MRKLRDWLEPYTEGESIDLLSDWACAAARKGGVRGVEIEKLIRKGDFASLLIKEHISYGDKVDGPEGLRELAYCRQALAFFQKLEFVDIGVDKQQAAVDAFLLYEERCRQTNEIFRLRRLGAFSFHPRVETIMAMARLIIDGVLNAAPTADELKFRFGPGATVTVPKREASIRRKLGERPDCSKDLIAWVQDLCDEMPTYASHHGEGSYAILPSGDIRIFPKTLKNVRMRDTSVRVRPMVYCRISRGILAFAPKNAKTYRTVEKQPLLNTMFQLAVGDEMSIRSRRSGLDLSNQAINRGLARLASLTDASATLDLKGASDTVARAPVVELFSDGWFHLLNAGRVGEIQHPRQASESIMLEKFSAMGNGFTFPLESLIFWSLTLAAHKFHFDSDLAHAKAECNVFGDDIICPSEMVPLLVEVLTAVGFLVNHEKSYSSGPFRESCGADFYKGFDIRPVYVKEILTPATLFTIHNGLQARGFCDLADMVYSNIHPKLALFGPPGYGDGHLVRKDVRGDYFMGTRKESHIQKGYEGRTFSTFARLPKLDYSMHRDGDSIWPAYAAYRRETTALTPDVEGLETWRFPSLCRALRRDGLAVKPFEPFVVEAPSDPLPYREVPRPNADFIGPMPFVKAATFPGNAGYRKSSIYTLG